jgi:hypothetical protein
MCISYQLWVYLFIPCSLKQCNINQDILSISTKLCLYQHFEKNWKVMGPLYGWQLTDFINVLNTNGTKYFVNIPQQSSF